MLSVLRATVALATVAALAGCGGTTTSSTAGAATSPASSATTVITISTRDLARPDIAVAPSTSGPSVVSLAFGAGETVAALGAASRLIGRDEASDGPDIHAAPVVTHAHEANAEQVIALHPAVVLVDTSSGPTEALDQIRSAGIDVVTIPEAWSLDAMPARVRAIASAITVPTASADAVLSAIPTTPPAAPTDAPRVAFLYLRGTSAIYLIGGKGSGADAMIAAAGARDVGADAGLDPFVPLSAEALAQLHPDVLLVMTKGLASVGGVDGLVALPGVAQTAAGQAKRVIAVDDTTLLSFGPRTPALIAALHDAIDKVTAA